MRFQLTREFFIPKNAIKIADKKSDAIAYLYANSAGQPCAKVFYGKQVKPVANYRYRSQQEREKSVTSYFESRRVRCGWKAEQQAARKAYKNEYAVGDILGTCWGYEQTNREYYEVTAVKGMTVTIRQIATERKAIAWAVEKAIPLPGSYVGEPIVSQATPGGVKALYGQKATKVSFESVAGIKVYSVGTITSYG